MPELDHVKILNCHVYYHNSALLRKRQKETIENTPAGVDYELNQVNISSEVKDTDIFKLHKFSWKFKLISLIKRCVPLLNVQKVNELELNDKLSYTWGKLILNKRLKYVVELDTPYVLTYYNVYFFRILKPLLKYLLKRDNCRQIVCISEASKRCLLNELGKELSSKTSVVYPWVKEQENVKKNKESNDLRLLFISTQFSLKGGRELLLAFSKLREKHPNLTLTLISNLTEAEIANLPEGVVFLTANIDKKELNENIYPNHDLFVLPSYQDSFGLVYLEALSHGLPIVSTDRFAMPEMIKNGINGITVTPPFKYYLDDCRANKEYWGIDLAKLTQKGDVDFSYVDSIAVSIEECIINLVDYSKASTYLFQTVYREDIRAVDFKNMLVRCFNV